VDAEFNLTVAEIAIALAGFTGLVAGLARGDRSQETQDYVGLMNILLSSGCAMAFALLPLALVQAGMGGDLVTRLCGALLGALVVCLTGYYTAIARRIRPRQPWLFWPMLVTGTLIAAGLVLESAGVLGANLYPVLLFWLLIVGFAQFFSFLVLSWRGPGPAT